MNRLTKIYNILFLLLISVTPACKKFLTEEPLTQVPTQSYFKSLSDVNAAMAGVYASFQEEMVGNGTTNFSGKFNYWGEGRSDNFDRHPNYISNAMVELSMNSLTSGNSWTSWAGLYRTIGRTNTAIKYIPQAAVADPGKVTSTVMNNNLAQCYAMRALCYFYIVRLWGDAPIWTEPYENVNEEDERPRESKNKLMDEVILPDLLNAYELIQKGDTPSVWYINEAAICAILADVYMWKKDYDQAIGWFNNLFLAKSPAGKVYQGSAETDLESTADWKKNLFLNPSSSKEAIWSIHWDNVTNGCACIPVSIGKNNNQVRIDSLIYTDWKKEKNDIRVWQTIDTLPGLGHYDKLTKYYDVPITGFPANADAYSYNVYLTMYRLGGMYLLYAEALNKTGDRANAIKYLNFVRARAGLVPYTDTDVIINSEENLEDAIIQERRYELFGEGVRWFDLVRTDKVKKIMDPVINRRYSSQGVEWTEGFGSNMDKILWPLYRQDLEDNKALIQNPSYN